MTDNFKGPENMIAIALSEREWARLSHGLSDIICWGRGYMAASKDNSSYDPMGLEEARELNILIKRNLPQ